MTLLGIKITYKMLLTGVALAPYITFIEKYIFDDWDALASLGLLMIIDTFTGIWRALCKKDKELKGFTYQGFSRILNKGLFYAIWIISFGILEKISISGKNNVILDWINTGAVTVLVIREGISIIGNILAVRPDSKLQKIFDRLNKYFDEEPKKLEKSEKIEEDGNI